MATCPVKSLPEWKQLVASQGEDKAYYLWDKYRGEVPDTEYSADAQLDIIPQIEELNNFELYENRDTLCASGICNFTAKKSTEKLIEVGLNPFPNPYGGSSLHVTVKSPLGDFDIVHYVSAVAINGSIYIYDMPQHEYISDDFFGQVTDVKLKTSYKPRLIALDVDSIKANYNLNSEEAAKFIRSILNTEEQIAWPSFKDYIKQNIDNYQEYISDLEKQITEEDVELDSHEEWVKREATRKSIQDLFKKSVLEKEILPEEENKIVSFLRRKLKFKTKQYLPTKTDSFILSNLIKNITGIRWEYIPSNLEDTLKEFDLYTKSPDFLLEIWQNYKQAKEHIEHFDKIIDYLFEQKRLLDGFFKLAKSVGFDEALTKYDSKQQYSLKSIFPSDIKSKYKSESQMIFMLQKKFSSLDAISKERNVLMGKTFSEILALKMRANTKFQKANTILNYLKAVNFDTSYISESIANEARRRYKYFSNKGQISYQIEDQPMSKASESTLVKVKEAAKKMGIDIQKLSDYLKGTPNIPSGINALADLVRGVIAIAEGKEDAALTEEFVHIATAMLEQTHPEIITEMISKIDKFKIYKRTLEEYKNNKNYQNADGKPNIRKIKKEAVDKLIAELIVQQNEGITEFPELMEETWKSTIRTWWSKILDFIRGDYRKANIDIFEEVAKQVLTGEVGAKYYKNAPIKEGVSELFESNSELANAVYKALGVNNDKASLDTWLEYVSEKDGITKEEAYQRIIDNNTKMITVYRGEGSTIDLADTNLPEYIKNSKGRWFTKDKEVAKTYAIQHKGELYAVMIPEVLFDNISKELKLEETNGVEALLPKELALKKQKISDITPQQKQQAVQVYSNFLSNFVNNNFDNIIQDLESKNILNKKCS